MPDPQRIAITGASGFIGSALAESLRRDGCDVRRLVRGATASGADVRWDPATGAVETTALGPIDALVHLAGESVAAGRWSKKRRRAIADSRGPTTERLCRTLAKLPQPPRVAVVASAIGIYGDRDDEQLDEDSAYGGDFLADVARAQERASRPLAEVGTRIVNLRIGLVLDLAGGALPRMVRPFRLGLGGRLGSGRQWSSWITRHDLVRAIRFALTHATLSGPVLATSPTPVTNRTFTQALAQALHRPALLPAPAFALRLVFGELADALLLASQRCEPKRLLAAGFTFDHATIDAALRAVLAR